MLKKERGDIICLQNAASSMNQIMDNLLHASSFPHVLWLGDAGSYAREKRKCKFAPNVLHRPSIVASGKVRTPG
jgi:hypothetical protein